MAPQNFSSTTLRVITQRLAVTPTWQLPNIVVYLASSIASCKDILTTADVRQQNNNASDAVVLAHKFKTQLSALLQDKSSEARWSAIVLIKAAFETGGWEFRRGCGPWVRGLLGILSKADPPTNKELGIITLTRIFLLIEEHQSLVREITTPSLPGFISSCLNLVKPQDSPRVRKNIVFHDGTLNAIIQSFCKLIPQHPTLFRPFIPRIRSLILPLIAATPSDLVIDEDSKRRALAVEPCVAQSARQLFVCLSSCAPKNDSSEVWAQSLHGIIRSLHQTADSTFRTCVQDWRPFYSRLQIGTKVPNDLARTVCGLDDDHSGLPAWRGIHAGVERIDGLLRTIQAFLTTPTKLSVSIPLGALFDATDRILSTSPARRESETEYGNPAVNPETEKVEREGLWTTLPMIKISALEVLAQIVLRLGQSSAITSHIILERSLWVFEAEHSNGRVRIIIYRLILESLKHVGLSLPKTITSSLSHCIKCCCEDLVPLEEETRSTEDSPTFVYKQDNNDSSINADSYLSPPSKALQKSQEYEEIGIAAASLLSIAISHVPSDFFAYSLRSQMDRTAILIRSKPSMLASVLNPPNRLKGAREVRSSMPLLARQFSCSLEVEALVRPRIPVSKARKDRIGDFDHNVDVTEGSEERNTKQHKLRIMTPSTETMLDLFPQERKESDEHIMMRNTELETIIQPRSRIAPPSVPETATPLTSRKRDRETSLSPGGLSKSADRKTLHDAPILEQNEAQKRACLEPGDSDKQELAKWASTELGLPNLHQSSTSEENLVMQPQTTTRTDAAVHTLADMSSSDESDFEMPMIDPEPDTDMEDDEDE